MLAAIVEHKAGTGNEVLNCPRDEYFAGTSERCDAGADGHRDTRELVVADLALADMNPRAHVDSERAKRVADCSGGMDRARRSVECGEEAVTRGVEFSTSIARKLVADRRMMALQEIPPPRISHTRHEFRRTDDVGEQDGCQHAARLRSLLQP